MSRKSGSLKESFQFAVSGLKDAWQKERNMKIHALATILALAAGFAAKLSRMEWLFMLSAIFFVLAMEMMNTALERVVDLHTSDIHPLAALAKNAAAGAALLAACYALLVGAFIFLPRIGRWINFF